MKFCYAVQRPVYECEHRVCIARSQKVKGGRSRDKGATARRKDKIAPGVDCS